MAQRVNAFNNAFKNCIFINRENASKTIVERIDEDDVFAEKPIKVNMERIDDTHDRLSLTFSNGELDGILTWRKTKEGNHYVLSGYELKE
jgi:hypothetical protein